ncbi:MAG: hypothetical protein AAF245_12655, partial [Pseudomonadota bacterium]
SISVAAIFASGVIIPVAAALILYLGLRRVNFKGALTPFYRFQIALAVAALLLALALWFNVIILIQGVPDV